MIQRVSILAPDLSQNNLGRAYLLARVLQRAYEVEVLGPVFGERIWPPADDGRVPYITVRGRNFPMFLGSIRYLLERISGDLVYAVKPRLSSFGVGLLHRRRTGTPLLLDIDDWDVAGQYHVHTLLRWVRLLWRLPNPYNNLYLYLMQPLIHRADGITVASTALQARFGGVFLPHGRDPWILDPNRFDRESLRRQHGLADKRVLMFLGTPRPHKGIEDVVAALQLIDDPDMRFLVVGVDWTEPYTLELQRSNEPRLRLIGMQPWSATPEFLALADVVVLAQRPVAFGQAQVPAKVFDAMAMAKPIVATAVGDLPEILAGCGLVVPPQDVSALARAIRRVFEHPDEAVRLGQLARDRCSQYYSWDVMADTLQQLIRTIEPQVN
jgi:glycosyltransferase involved in cell wall biosynthesis